MIRFQDITIDRSKRTIARNGVTMRFTPLFFRFACVLLLAGPMTKPALFDLLYDDREDGGPLGGLKMIDVLLCQIKPKLAALSLTLCSDGERYWWHKRYWAAPLSLPEALEAAE
jgi:hypothetical protein